MLDVTNMNDYPLAVFIALLLGQGIAEYAAMLRTGTLKRKRKREWTYYVVAVPYKAMFLAAIVEHIEFGTHPTTPMMLAGIFLATAGIAVRVVCHLELAGAFSQYVQKFEGQKLIHSGMYATIRHPMYLGVILLLVGMPLVLAVRFTWLLCPIGLVGLIIRIRKEEALLIRELPGYREYTERTWRLVPHIY